jgi:hypothetical protein
LLFFKIPPKLPNKSSNKIRKRVNNHHATTKEQQQEEELLESNYNSSGDDVSDMEVYELFKDV